jgi:hypothetical protein
MRAPISVTVAAAILVSTFMAAPAIAKEVSIAGNSEGELKSKCNAGGGLFFPKDRSNGAPSPDGVYACLTKGGDLVTCGGGTDEQKKTCTISRLAPNDRARLKSRLTVKPRKR